MPRFGGYDPVAVARDAGVPGDPRLWSDRRGTGSISSIRPRRAPAFADNFKTIVEAAARSWPAVQTTLSALILALRTYVADTSLGAEGSPPGDEAVDQEALPRHVIGEGRSLRAS